ncbi:MAG: pseudouridine synthase [Panacagrimonas sp.]|nr:pseudouridine synthase [Panacagrimonas sp.]MCC2656945.1 pseudouridine synthase [Panacagrimonas sp.]
MRSTLPDRDGVGASHVQVPAGTPATAALAFLAAHFPSVSRQTWGARFERGLILSANGAPLAVDARVTAGDDLYYYRELATEPRIPFAAEVIWRDEHLLIVDKPHFLPVIPAGRWVRESLLVRLRHALGLVDLVPLHRIDRHTAGLVAFSLDPETRAAYQALFPRREVTKVYEAVAPLRADLALPCVRRSCIVRGEPFMRMQEASDAEPNSETRIELIERRGDGLARYRLQPITGRKHQLRVHLNALGIPIANDPLYPDVLDTDDEDFSAPMKLLARRLEFVDPIDGHTRRFESRRFL